jgi:hypothetical protein
VIAPFELLSQDILMTAALYKLYIFVNRCDSVIDECRSSSRDYISFNNIKIAPDFQHDFNIETSRTHERLGQYYKNSGGKKMDMVGLF